MKLLLIFCDSGVEERVLEGLRRVGVPGYSRLAEVSGSGRTGRRDGDPVWPGTNSLLMVAVPSEEAVDAVREMVLTLKQEYIRAPALHAFTLEATELF